MSRLLKELVLLVEGVAKLVADSVSQIFPDEPTNISSLIAVELNHLPQSVCAKDDAL